MKLQLDKVILVNLCFRVALLVYLLKDDSPETPKDAKPFKHWLDPISKTVFLICVNGLGSDFLKHNSTPFLRKTIESEGSLGVVLTRQFETNCGGFETILTGSTSQPFPFSWLTQKCQDTILDYVGCKYGMGANIPEEIASRYNFSKDSSPLENFFKWRTFTKPRRSCLFVLSLDLDPVLIRNYHHRLRKLDEDIRLFVKVATSIYGHNKTTFIVTSARGSPVGKNLGANAPLVAWGKGIANIRDVVPVKHGDLTAMLSALLGISFPTGLFGIIPMRMMNIHEYYVFELTLYTIKHFEHVLELPNVKEYLLEAAELEMNQLVMRLQNIISGLQRSKSIIWICTSFLLFLLLWLWMINLITYSLSGFANVFFSLKTLYLLLVVVVSTLMLNFPVWPLIVALEFLIFWTVQNARPILLEISKTYLTFLKTFILTFLSFTFAGVVGNRIAIPVFFVPVIFLPFFNDSYRRVNPFVLYTRLLSGFALSALPLARTFGEVPDNVITSSISVLFVLDYYMLLFIFRSEMDAHSKISAFFVLVTTAHVTFLRDHDPSLSQGVLSAFLLSFSLLSVYFASGTLLQRLLKVYLSLFIPVLMFTVKLECIFYFATVFHIFTWIFLEYHSVAPNKHHFSPGIFSVPPTESSDPIEFSSQDKRQIVFFVVYNYLSYFAAGNYPDLHSYDLYVAPTFFYKYPKPVSFVLGGFRFFLPFFITTTAFLTLCSLQKKNFSSLIGASVCLSDLIGFFFVFYSEFINRLLHRTVFPVKFSYFVVEQFAVIAVILSYFLGRRILFRSEG